MNYINYNQFIKDIYGLLVKLPRNIGGVLGVPRSGIMPAAIIATELHIPLGIIGCDTFFGGSRMGQIKYDENLPVLVIDDTVCSGASMANAKSKNTFKNSIYACVYVTPGSEKHVDFYSKQLAMPRVFEWNLFNSTHITTALLDMDGVICVDPVPFDDDGVEYQMALKNAIPLHIPHLEVAGIVTNRLERWRGITEEWLARHNVKYKTLVMSQYNTAEERRKHNTAEYKADNYIRLGASLFVESSTWQAKRIAEITKKPVICIDDKTIYQ